ncbi:MAG: YceI family protein [Bacteroidota bacterium]
MKKSVLIIGLVIAAGATFAQKKVTTSAIVSFDATTSKDALPKADNKTVVASLDTKKGTVAFEAIVKNFAFSNPMIQDHFNAESWMNSEKFSTAAFTGNITNLSAINFKKDGTYTAQVEGDLTIHGETQKVKTTATIVVSGSTITTKSDFTVKLEDYKVSGPAIGAGKVSKEPKITVSAEFK